MMSKGKDCRQPGVPHNACATLLQPAYYVVPYSHEYKKLKHLLWKNEHARTVRCGWRGWRALPATSLIARNQWPAGPFFFSAAIAYSFIALAVRFMVWMLPEIVPVPFSCFS